MANIVRYKSTNTDGMYILTYNIYDLNVYCDWAAKPQSIKSLARRKLNIADICFDMKLH